MGLSGCELVGEPVQFGSCKGLGVGEAALSLWVQTHRDCPSSPPAYQSRMCVLKLRELESLR